MSEHDGLVQSWHECYGAGDRAATLDYYAEDATWQVAWWREPHVGREAIGAVLDRQFS